MTWNNSRVTLSQELAEPILTVSQNSPGGFNAVGAVSCLFAIWRSTISHITKGNGTFLLEHNAFAARFGTWTRRGRVAGRESGRVMDGRVGDARGKRRGDGEGIGSVKHDEGLLAGAGEQ
jgi:hypothetical protein